MTDILFITVNYNGVAATEKFLASAAELEAFTRVQILVVDNHSADGSIEKLRAANNKFSNVSLIESERNRGYFGAANWALQQYLAGEPMPDWIIVCNNDIIFEDRDFLVGLLRNDPRNAHVIAPAIIALATGIDCNPFLRERPTSFRLWSYRFWSSSYYLMWLKQFLSPYVRSARHKVTTWFEPPTTTNVRRTYAPHGAFLIFSRAYFEAGGYIDDGFFLYAEEFSVAEICRRLNLSIIHDSSLRVWHNAHHVTGRFCNRTTFEYGRQGLAYALRTYFSAADSANRPAHENAPTNQSAGSSL